MFVIPSASGVAYFPTPWIRLAEIHCDGLFHMWPQGKFIPFVAQPQNAVIPQCPKCGDSDLTSFIPMDKHTYFCRCRFCKLEFAYRSYKAVQGPKYVPRN